MLGKPRTRRFRDPERTRERLLQAAYQEVRRTGFRGAGIDTILAATNVTKGALYHHFGSKEALGHAVIDHFIARITSDKWLAPLDDVDDPIDALIEIVEGTSFAEEDVAGGCPLNNLAQE